MKFVFTFDQSDFMIIFQLYTLIWHVELKYNPEIWLTDSLLQSWGWNGKRKTEENTFAALKLYYVRKF